MSDFDLDAYISRIGYGGPRAPTLEVLRALLLAHPQAIPFENLDPLLGRGVRLDLASLQAKLVHGRRGGYCFEQNLLFHAALQALGFDVVPLAGRVYLDRPKDAGIPARTHLTLRVTIGKQDYLADVGFGGQTPTGPVAFAMGEVAKTPHEPYRLQPAGDERDLEALVAGTWKHLYRFGLDPAPMIDLEVANHYVATHPASFFRNALMGARVAPDGRYTLLNDRVSFHRLDGGTKSRTLQNADALIDELTATFGLAALDSEAVAAAFERTRSKR